MLVFFTSGGICDLLNVSGWMGLENLVTFNLTHFLGEKRGTLDSLCPYSFLAVYLAFRPNISPRQYCFHVF